MTNPPQLISEIKSLHDKGMYITGIHDRLLKQGFSESQISEAFLQSNLDLPKQTPEPTKPQRPVFDLPVAKIVSTLFFLVICFGVYYLFLGETTYDGIKIRRGYDCIDKTQKALTLIKTKAPAHFAEVKKYIGVIECVTSGSGMAAYETPPRFQVGDRTRDESTLWYAGTIVHDANHSKLFHQYKSSHPQETVPESAWTGYEAEKFCLDYQYSALEQMGADTAMLEGVKNAINTSYWEEPNRNW